MIKIKNVRPGILIIADAGLKLAPGESVELDALTPQARKAVDDGLLSCTERSAAAKPDVRADSKVAATAESKPKGKSAGDGADNKEAAKKGKGQPAEGEQSQAPDGDAEQKPEEQPGEAGQGQLLGTEDAPK